MGRLPLLGLLFAYALFAQSDCREIDFRQARQIDAAGRTEITLFVRAPDGGFFSAPHQAFPPYPRKRADADSQVRFMGCSPEVAAHGGVPSAMAGRPAGSPASNVALIRNIGNGLGAGVWTRYANDSITVYLQRDDLTFLSETRYTIPGSANGIQFADLDRDGFPDIFLAYVIADNGGFSFLKGNGDGTFQQARNTPLAGVFPGRFALVDFNGDARLDLVTPRPQADRVTVLLGNGDGTFRESASFPTAQFPNVALAADLNADGRADIAVGSFSGGITLLAGNGDGTFRAPVNIAGGVAIHSLAAGDLNKDGRVDLAVSSEFEYTVGILPGNGDGTFQTPVLYLAGFAPQSLILTDMNADGNVDVVAGEGLAEVLTPQEDGGYFTVLFGKGDGALVAAPVTRIPTRGSSIESATSMAAADFNGDSRLDVAAGSLGEIAILLGRAGGGWQPGNVITVAGADVRHIAAADFNGDGRADLAVADPLLNRVSIFSGDGAGGFLAPTHIAMTDPVFLLAADFNGDGRPDLAVACADLFGPGADEVRVLIANAGGGFQAPVAIRTGSNPRALAAGDLNGDGRLDLVVSNSGTFGAVNDPGGVTVLLGNGNGTFQSGVNLAAGQFPARVTVADVTGDRNLDIVVPSSGSNFDEVIAIFDGRGNGTFAAPRFLPTDFGPSIVRVADFSRDGRVDLIISHCCGETDMTYMLGDAAGGFAVEKHFPGGADPIEVIVADLNGDGPPDLLLLNNVINRTGYLTTLINTSPAPPPFTTVSAASVVRGPVAPESIASAFGAGLATGSAGAESADLPEELAGTRVRLRDARGAEFTARLFFASPGQVNFLVPAGMSQGRGSVTIVAGDGRQQTSPIEIAPVAPGIFANEGVAAALVYRYPEGQSDPIVEQVATRDASGRIAPLAIDLGPATDRLFLIMFGTGLRGRGRIDDVLVRYGDVPGVVSYAGPQLEYEGLDQINVSIPRSLAGRGDLNVLTTVDGLAANTVRVRVR